jgi:putative transposase
MTFVRNHAKAMLACDFFVSVTVRFQVVYVFLIMEVGTRRLIRFNLTSYPTATWTLQQFREAIDNEQDYRFLIHDRDSIYSEELDLAVRAMGSENPQDALPISSGELALRAPDRSLRRDCC